MCGLIGVGETFTHVSGSKSNVSQDEQSGAITVVRADARIRQGLKSWSRIPP